MGGDGGKGSRKKKERRRNTFIILEKVRIRSPADKEIDSSDCQLLFHLNEAKMVRLLLQT